MGTDLLEQRLLGRATFGPRPGDRERIRELGAEAWLESELAAARGPDAGREAGLDARLARFPALALDPEGFVEGQGLPDPEEMSGRDAESRLVKLHARALRTAREVAAARVVRAVHAARGLHEVMVDFWANHFSVDARKGIVGGLVPHYQRDVLDRFEDLLLAVARSPAMLFYLDNWSSTAAGGGGRLARRRRRGINENYARELLELHTLGVDGGYGQADVIATARVLTGWSLESRRRPVYTFHAALHDTGEKLVLGQRVRGEGEEEGVTLLRRLARHPATARHVSRRLARRFVADDPPPALVDRVARGFLEQEGDIAATLRVLLLAPELADPAHRKLKTPLRFVASALRASGRETAGDDDLLLALARLGELPFFARTPKGFPEESARWIDPGAALARIDLGVTLGGGDARHAVAFAAPEFQWC